MLPAHGSAAQLAVTAVAVAQQNPAILRVVNDFGLFAFKSEVSFYFIQLYNFCFLALILIPFCFVSSTALSMSSNVMQYQDLRKGDFKKNAKYPAHGRIRNMSYF